MERADIEVRTEDGCFGAYLATPDNPNGAGLVVLQEIFGVNANMRSVADALAEEGFTAIVPDLFWRQEPGLALDQAADRERAMELMNGLDSNLAVEDALRAADHLRDLLGAEAKIGAVGYCLGGKLAFLLSTRPGIDAAASYYGVAIQAQLDQIANVKCPLLLHIAEKDHLCPPDAQGAIEAAANRHSDHITVLRYPNVGHAFARRGGAAFDKQAAERADRATLEMLRDNLLECMNSGLSQAMVAVSEGSRILASLGVLDAFGHISCRSPERPDRFLIARNLAPAMVRPDDVVELDLDGELLSSGQAVSLFKERFIHAEIYRRRDDVQAVVHSHALTVLPFTVVPGVRIRPVCHMCGFLQDTPKAFDLAEHAGDGTDLLISNAYSGRLLAEHLGQANVVPMRAHGFTVIGADVPQAVFHAVYTMKNCEIELAARALGEPAFLTDSEAAACRKTIGSQISRAWNLWLTSLTAHSHL